MTKEKKKQCEKVRQKSSEAKYEVKQHRERLETTTPSSPPTASARLPARMLSLTSTSLRDILNRDFLPAGTFLSACPSKKKLVSLCLSGPARLSLREKIR